VSTIYALLVGINDYPAGVAKLAGCINDVDNVDNLLLDRFDKSDLAIEVLKDSDATRENVIERFRSHLGRAKDGDVALFHYCGHGARWYAAPEFQEFYTNGLDEGLVCVDSRLQGGFDLADKELAALLAELSRNDPHIAVVLDCCHSGSGTRGADEFRGLQARVTDTVATPRPLDSYLDGYYAGLRRRGEPMSIPASRHILLAACDRSQTAKETRDRSGVFTSTLVEVLDKSGGDLTYADLFVRCRAAVRTRADDQTPQFEALGRFNAQAGFLGRTASFSARRYSVYFEGDAWKVDCGAIHGAPTEPEKTVAFSLYPEDDHARPAGTAVTVQVGPQKSELKLDFESDPALRYRAELTSLPVAPLVVDFEGPAAARDALQKAIDGDGAVAAALTDSGKADYRLVTGGGTLWLEARATGLRIQGVALDPAGSGGAAAGIAPVLKQVARWERSLALQNRQTRLDRGLVDFVFAEQLGEGQEHVYPEGDVTLDYAKVNGEWKNILGKFKARNHTSQTLYMILAYFSADFGLYVLRNDTIKPSDLFTTLWGDGPDDYFFLPEGENAAVERFKLIVSTERVDDFLLRQDPLELGGLAPSARALGGIGPAAAKMPLQNEWLTKDCAVTVARRLDRVGARDCSVAVGKIVVKGHPTVTANLALAAARTPTRGAAGGSDFYRALEQSGMEMLDFSSTRGDNQSVLELTDIRNAESLREHPLEIEVDLPLAIDEAIIPLVFDGQHVLLGGETYKGDNGLTHISIDQIPEVADNRRSLGGALKLYFFKTYLKLQNVNQLRWINNKADSGFEYKSTQIAEKVAAASNILLVVHGIIGDTEDIVKGLRAAKLDEQFDLVLTYDYENLNTSIEQTARDLKAQLAAAGVSKGDGKRLTVLAHSMGGLVSRWFIEREGGAAVVDHLVLCGTPSHGSPFGYVDQARRVIAMLATLSINFLPATAPFSGALMLLLNRSKKLTPTLEQMNPASDFLKTLNASKDPRIAYTVLAGNIADYKEPSEGTFDQLIAKVGRNAVYEALFPGKANDIAVAVDSILEVGAQRAVAPVRLDVACYHMNYFSSAAGQSALRQVAWNA
jgi:pimeloyl-ACP methyl ester carboxylesterase